jgi:hypothetical protein
MSRELIVNNQSFDYPTSGTDLSTTSVDLKKKRSRNRASGEFVCETCLKAKKAGKMSRYKSEPRECKVCHIKRTQNPFNIKRLRPLKVCPAIKLVNNILTRKRYKLKNRDKIREFKNNYRRKNPLSRRGENQFRERTIKNQIIARQYRKEIRLFYKNCPEGFQVDHIIPILNENVCGLHVPWNLQYLNPFDNNKKNNKWDGTYNNEGWKK